MLDDHLDIIAVALRLLLAGESRAVVQERRKDAGLSVALQQRRNRQERRRCLRQAKFADQPLQLVTGRSPMFAGCRRFQRLLRRERRRWKLGVDRRRG